MNRLKGRTYPPAVLHLPHASTYIPAHVRPTLLPDETALEDELLRMTDHFTDRLFELSPAVACPILGAVSRLVVDVERFPDDAREPMAAQGMGAVYTRTSRGGPLRSGLTATLREALLNEYYYTHHAALTKSVERALLCHSRCLILDCHSFSSQPLPHEPDQRPDRPEICLGTDPFHTPPELAAQARELFAASGFTVEIDRPFSGALVPERFYQRRAEVYSLMVEVNRSLYMDEATGAPLPEFETFRERLREGLEALIALTPRLPPA